MIITGQEVVAEVFRVTPKTIGLWQEQGFPVARKGGPHIPSQYCAADCVAWVLERELAKIRTESPKDRLNRLQADKIEMDLMQSRGVLVPVAAIEPHLRAAVIAARTFLRDSPGRLAEAVYGKDKRATESILAATFDQFLTKLAGGMMLAAGASQPGTPDQDGDEPDDEPA